MKKEKRHELNQNFAKKAKNFNLFAARSPNTGRFNIPCVAKPQLSQSVAHHWSLLRLG